MTRLIPEKTIEIWTTFSLVYHLGPRTRIWSWPTGADQIVWTADIRKWFMLELKAPEDAQSPYMTVDLSQLRRYINKHWHGVHPDVLYVLPTALQGPVPRTFTSIPADHLFQRWFCNNTYVIRATELAGVLNGPLTSSPPAKSARIRGVSGRVEHYGRRRSRMVSNSMPTLHDTLVHIRDCNEPPGISLRSRATFGGPPTSEAEDGYERWPLSLEAVQRTLSAVAEGRPGRLVLVGLE